jgi:hypothetical protein
MLAGTPVASSAVAAAKVADPVVEPTRSQRNVGLPSPAGPRVTVGGFGAVAPEIVVPANATVVPQGSNVVAIEGSRVDEDRGTTSTLPGTSTTLADAQPIAAVTAAVRAWAAAHATTADDLRIRVDGDTAVARFRDGSKDRALTLKRDGAAWTVTGERSGS